MSARTSTEEGQDFHAAFGLGVSDKLIDTVDPDGVALAAIQGLNEKLEEKDAEIAELRAKLSKVDDLDSELVAMREQVSALLPTYPDSN